MYRIFTLLFLIGCSSTKPHPDFLGDCMKQPCGAYIPGSSGGSVTPTDAGTDTSTSDTGLADTGDDSMGTQDVIVTEAGEQ